MRLKMRTGAKSWEASEAMIRTLDNSLFIGRLTGNNMTQLTT